jgi:hypothetical protein
MRNFDVIVLYSAQYAFSPNDRNYRENTPFSRTSQYEEYIASYEYLLSQCQISNMNVAFAVSNDVIGPGTFKGYWTYDKKWKRNKGLARTRVLFDRFKPTYPYEKKSLKLLIQDQSIKTFVNKNIKKVFNDKYCTFETFNEYAIPTIKLSEVSEEGIANAIKKLKVMLKKPKNFESAFIVKDRFGGGGKRIYYIRDKKDFKNTIQEIQKGSTTKFIVQPCIALKNAKPVRGYKGVVEMRVVLMNGVILSSWLRLEPEGSDTYDKKNGERRIVISPQELPLKVHKAVSTIREKLPKKRSLYTLDFVMTINNDIFLLEGNNKPGLGWDKNDKIDAENKKMLIDAIVVELKKIMNESKGLIEPISIKQTHEFVHPIIGDKIPIPSFNNNKTLLSEITS